MLYVVLWVRHGVTTGVKVNYVCMRCLFGIEIDQKQEEKHFTGKPPAVLHFAGIVFYTLYVALQCG